jgi:hypothetical protein
MLALACCDGLDALCPARLKLMRPSMGGLDGDNQLPMGFRRLIVGVRRRCDDVSMRLHMRRRPCNGDGVGP